MRYLLLVVALLCALCASVNAQTAISAQKVEDSDGVTKLDNFLFTQMQISSKLADDLVASKLAALRKLPEFREYEEALKAQTAVRDDIASKVKVLTPQQVFDFVTRTMKPLPEKTASVK